MTRLPDSASSSHRFCVAPMMDWTDRHCRYFMRLITRHALLYTEMVTTGALIHGDARRFLAFDPTEQPVALQLGGSVADELAHCARLARDHGYSEVNLNVGCPSDRVQNNMIGACLMAHPHLVADGVKAMRDAVDIPVTVKCRIGIDGMDSEAELQDFIGTVAEAGCERFIVHARIAILQGLSPKENREIPPLNYERVFRMKAAFPGLTFVINGGIQSMEQTRMLLDRVDGVMVGREAYQNPWFLADVDKAVFGRDDAPASRFEVVGRLLPYVERELDRGVELKHITRHILGLFQGLPGAKRFRRFLSENAYRPEADLATLRQALSLVREA